MGYSYNIHVVPTYANPKGNYGRIVNSFSSSARAIDEAEKLHSRDGQIYVVSNGLITIFDSRKPRVFPQRAHPMTPTQYKAAIKALGLSQRLAGDWLGIGA
jgi:hypothetical protein